MFMRGLAACLMLGLGMAIVAAVSPQAPADPVAVPNDNRTAAGGMTGDTLRLRLVAVRARWFILGDSNPAFSVAAFAEEGSRPSVPGPLVRVQSGTPMHATVRNTLPDTLVVRGLGDRGGLRDSLVILPGETVETRFAARRVGTYLYWATTSGARRILGPNLQASNGLLRAGFDSQLAGAFIVDPPGHVVNDRVFVITELADQTRSRAGDLNRDRHGTPPREFTAFNGRSWPYNERFAFDVGDTVRWRFVNASLQPHPLHLHGFYFRVDSHAATRAAADSIFTPDERRMAVTESVPVGSTISITWSPDRPGGWIFHCHLTQHAIRLPAVDNPNDIPYPSSHHDGNPDQHVLGMNGLVIGITVSAPTRPAETWRPVRRLRLFVQSDSAPADSLRRFGYILQNGDEPRPDSVQYPGPVLVLERGQPTSIEVINRTAEPTAVHWHGIELDSYYDGAVGWSGDPGRRTAPAIRPGAGFEVRITPRRAGTFMYHTHFDDLRQQYGGLVGALIVLEPGERWDPARDLVFLLSDGVPRVLFVNGSLNPPVVDLDVGTTYRIRIADIAVNRPGLPIRFMRDSTLVSWRPIARDGFSLPASQSTVQPAVANLPSGTTADFAFTPDAPGQLEMRLLPAAAVIRFRVSARSP